MRPTTTFAHDSTLGCWGRIAHPVDVAVDGRTGTTYVLNRSTAWHAPHGRAVGVVGIDGTEAVVRVFGALGTEPGHLFMPTSLAVGPDGRVYVADEHLHAISVFDDAGAFVTRWGGKGREAGEFDRPSGLAFDSQGRLIVVDHGNARVQCLTPTGECVHMFGAEGAAPGEFSLPWGVTVDHLDRIWVADWQNDRIQCFSVDGVCQMVLGGAAGEGATFRRPAAVAVDRHGTLYVTDWGNDRVMVFDAELNHVATWYGDAVLSTWALARMEEFPAFTAQRAAAGLYDQERRFWRPTGLEALPDGRVLVADTGRHRVQVYRGVERRLEPFALALR